MQYRNFGKTGKRVSALGFGCMRLPTIGGDAAAIDEELATQMVRHAIDEGVNYVDTAYYYHSSQSEPFVGRALQDGYREKVHLATKLPSGPVDTAEDFDRLLNEQLERLQTEHIDFYLLHAMNARSWPKLRDLGVRTWAEGAIADGRIGCLGFSFHDTLSVFKGIIDDYDNWTFCQIQYNYVDQDIQATSEGLRYAADRGMAVVVMEPIRGGRLASLPPTVSAILGRITPSHTQADLALQWVWNQPEVSLALSGMSTMQQVVENLASADRSGIGSLSAQDLALIDQARDKYRELCPIPCTECRYCLPCPNGVFIHANLGLYNRAMVQDELEEARRGYAHLLNMGEQMQAKSCIGCRECEERCPQQIPISEWMPKVHELLGAE